MYSTRCTVQSVSAKEAVKAYANVLTVPVSSIVEEGRGAWAASSAGRFQAGPEDEGTYWVALSSAAVVEASSAKRALKKHARNIGVRIGSGTLVSRGETAYASADVSQLQAVPYPTHPRMTRDVPLPQVTSPQRHQRLRKWSLIGKVTPSRSTQRGRAGRTHRVAA